MLLSEWAVASGRLQVSGCQWPVAGVLYYMQHKFGHGCVNLLNSITTAQVSDTTMLNSSNIVGTQKTCTFLVLQPPTKKVASSATFFVFSCVENVMNYSGNIFNYSGNALPAANTSGYHAVLFIKPLHIVRYLYSKFSAGTTQRMTERNSATINIYNIGI